MKPKTKIAIGVLAAALIIAVIVAILVPSSVDFGNLDFQIEDKNNDYQYEVGETLTFTLSDSSMSDRSIVWYFGNGDTIQNEQSVEYTFKEAGKYMVTLELDSKYPVSKYLDIVQASVKRPEDSLVKINGPEIGYIGEELIFSSYGPGMESWFWEFGETGNIDAYEGQVVYVYREPGVYTVKLKTNTSEYPVSQKIEILSLFEAIDESDPVDSLGLIHNDIRRRLQAIADGSVENRSSFYDNVKYLEKAYTCGKGEVVVVVVNGDKYNDFYSYCQGLHTLEGRGKSTLNIDDVKVNILDNGCINRIEVSQRVIEL
jgi:hypothetical protein